MQRVFGIRRNEDSAEVEIDRLEKQKWSRSRTLDNSKWKNSPKAKTICMRKTAARDFSCQRSIFVVLTKEAECHTAERYSSSIDDISSESLNAYSAS